MLNLYLKLKNLLDQEQGQGMVEYAMIVGLVAIGVIALLSLFGTQVGQIFTSITNSLKTIPGVTP